MLSLLFLACGPATVPDATGDDTGLAMADPFPWERIIDVDVTIDPDDWDALRTQTRTLGDILDGDCLAQEFDKPWTYFPADVVVDGDAFPGIEVRKKGFLGSLSETRPSLKVKLDTNEDITWRGLNRLTLNNSRQDASRLNTCLAYEVFRDAGVAAPRCSYAQVRVNGESLGLYAHVESIKQAFLSENFRDADGEHWEGTLSDFRTEWIGTYEAKNNAAEDSDKASLEAIRAILEEGPDETLLADLAPWIDVDDFLTFWATEMLIGHWDGYASNTNNHHLYRDPADDRFRFMPWGADAVLHNSGSAVAANGILARRLYLLEETRDQYLDRLLALLDTAWDEAALHAEVDRLEDLVWEIASEENEGFFDSVDGIREYLDVRRSDIEAELAGGPPAWNAELRGTPCFVESGTIDAEFETTWGTWTSNDPFGEGSAEVNITWGGNPIEVVGGGAIAGDPGDGSGAIAVTVIFPDETYGLAYVTGDPEQFQAGATIPLDFDAATGALYYASLDTGYEFQFLGYLYDGDLVLTEGGTNTGDPIVGTLDTVVVNLGW